jgi:hypothetical protein
LENKQAKSSRNFLPDGGTEIGVASIKTKLPQGVAYGVATATIRRSSIAVNTAFVTATM